MNEGDIIFLSASVPYRTGWVEDARSAEIEEAIVSIARAVFARKGRLLFGGHPSVSPLISAIAGEYYAVDPQRSIRPVVTFQAEHFRGRLPDETWEMHRMGWSAIEWTPLVLDADGNSDETAGLALMRKWMLLGRNAPEAVRVRNGLKPPKAMLAVGGMEGVRDEAAIFLRNGLLWGVRPAPSVFALASGGGAAARLLEPVELWNERLWLGRKADPLDRQILTQARQHSALVGLEQDWRQVQKTGVPSDLPFEPYAAMAQWLMDTL